MLGIKDAIRRIYSGESALVKHIILFILVGIPVMLSSPLNEISKTKNIDSGALWLSLSALIVMMFISIYTCGYFYGVIKNSFNETSEELLPDFNITWFKVFFKGFPLQITWCAYSLCFIIIWVISAKLCAFIIPPRLSIIITLSIFLLFIIIFAMMLPFVFVMFAKEYKRDGLYRISIPFSYIKQTFKSVILLYLKLIPMFLVFGILGILGNGTTVFSYFMASVAAYIGMIIQYIVHFCYVQIYKEKILSNQK